MDVFYFSARYAVEDNGYEEQEQHGFVVAESFNKAMDWVVDYFRGDLLSVEISYLGDTGLISTDNKEIAEGFKRSYLKTHYGEE